MRVCGGDRYASDSFGSTITSSDVTVDLESVVGLLIAAEMYELEALREICKSFVLYHAHEVFRDPQIVELPEKLLLEVRACPRILNVV